jgi:hypothetical protein
MKMQILQFAAISILIQMQLIQLSCNLKSMSCITSISAGIIMFRTPLDENVDSSILCNFESDSKASDSSELQFEKHDLQNTSILAGIMIFRKPLFQNSRFSIAAI